MKKPTISTAPRATVAPLAQAIAGERARIASILEAPEARGRMDMAVQLALYSDMQPAAAINLLKTAPAAESPFVQVMNQIGASGVPASMAAGSGDDPKAVRLAEIKKNVESFNIARGYRQARREG